jgi:hypothetical protein
MRFVDGITADVAEEFDYRWQLMTSFGNESFYGNNLQLLHNSNIVSQIFDNCTETILLWYLFSESSLLLLW